uniref:Uncharacterized protein n=1 Tax=Molossus molossus TaxID=27622 RepID=A0A7J8CRR2_MOLMO|nr:hypothetical protein HJG59_009735 [Molossus molossus]
MSGWLFVEGSAQCTPAAVWACHSQREHSPRLLVPQRPGETASKRASSGAVLGKGSRPRGSGLLFIGHVNVMKAPQQLVEEHPHHGLQIPVMGGMSESQQRGGSGVAVTHMYMSTVLIEYY